MITEHTTCRVCDGDLDDVFSLGWQYINTFPDEWPAELRSCPIDLAVCKNRECELLQLKHTAPQELLYSGHYWYRSGINPKIVNDLKEIAELFDDDGVWIDIGANDGTLLRFVGDYTTIGIEPAQNLTEELSEHADVVYEGFWEDYEGDVADVITAIGMFYDSEDPNAFVSNMRDHLKYDGVIVAQLMTLHPMLENADVGNLCHEHIEHYSYKSVRHLFERNGLEIFRVEENDINGGSYRLFARHYNKGSIDYDEPEPDYDDFVRRIEENRRRVVEKVRSSDNVYLYGASTKANTILQYYELGPNDIEAALEIHPEKVGKYTLTGIPIVEEEKYLDDADHLLVLPYGFRDIFVEQLKDWDGTMIFASPEYDLYSTE